MTTNPTANLKLSRPDFNSNGWHDDVNDNATKIDAAVGLLGLEINGVWQPNTQVNAGERYVDLVGGKIWEVQVSHVTLGTTFALELAQFPSYWSASDNSITFRGAYVAGTAYKIGDMYFSATEYLAAIVKVNHVGAPNPRTDATAGRTQLVFDVKSAAADAAGSASAAQQAASAAGGSASAAGASATGAAASAATAKDRMDAAAASATSAGNAAGTATAKAAEAVAAANAAAGVQTAVFEARDETIAARNTATGAVGQIANYAQDAEGAATASQNSATNSASSASAANTSEEAAAGSAAAAAGSATAAGNSATAAETSADNAAAANTQAQAAKDTAVGAVNATAASATAAGNSATAAENFATAASGAATTATNKAAEATAQAEIAVNAAQSTLTRKLQVSFNHVADGLAPVFVIAPYACNITGWTVLGNAVGRVTIEIRRSTYATYDPLTGGTPLATGTQLDPKLGGTANKERQANATGDFQQINAGDLLAFKISEVVDLTAANLILELAIVE